MLIGEWRYNVGSEVTIKCIDTVMVNWGFVIFFANSSKFGHQFLCPQNRLRSQKQPALTHGSQSTRNKVWIFFVKLKYKFYVIT